MSRRPIRLDQKFAKEIGKRSGGTLNQCYQCATCSSVCQLSTDESPFPRKNMILARWGAKEQLFSDPNIWYCHQCSDCSEHCPRGARPAEVLGAARAAMIEEYAKPRFLGKLLARPAYLPVIVLIPVLFILTMLAIAGTLHIPEGHVEFGEFFPHLYLNTSFSGLFMLSCALAAMAVVKHWKVMREASGATDKLSWGKLIGAIISTKLTVASHAKFNTCSADKTRFWSHLLVLYGFVGLLIVTGIVVLMIIIDPTSYPMGFWHPVKLAGNITGLMLVLGTLIMILSRLFANKEKHGSSYYDWLFLIDLFLVGVTGLASQMLRFADHVSAYPVYFVHLVCIFILLIYLPYTKFAHIYHRFTAMTFNRYQELSRAEAKQPEAAKADDAEGAAA